MLTSLHIENIAVVEKTDIAFERGFNVLTGETGAGKSIVIDAISAVLGERTSHDLIRTGADSALVTAVFEQLDQPTTQAISELGFDCADNSVMIFRKIASDGRNTVKINGLPANVSILKSIGALLVNIHGQHDSQSLIDPSGHLNYVDAVADDAELRERYRSAYNMAKDASKRLNRMKNASAEGQQRADFLRFAISELVAAEIEVGERDELIRQRDLMRNSVEVAERLSGVYGMLDGSEDTEGIPSVLESAAKALNEAQRYLPQLGELAEKLSGFGYEIEDIASAVNDELNGINFDPALLESIETRLDYLYRLSKKYGASEQDMLDYLQNARDELQSIDCSEESIESLEREYKSLMAELEGLALELTDVRRKAADSLAKSVCRELEFLDMPKAKFLVNIEEKDYAPDGCDNVEFLISANAGEPPKPISRIASGGELSRIMLAIKSVLADNDSIGTLIFDEIDTGISGSAARKVGIKMRQTSVNRQVLCVTHLAQIASLADCHFRIEKHSDNERTFTDVIPLDYRGRIDEVARIMSTGVTTDAMRASAKELIDLKDKM